MIPNKAIKNVEYKPNFFLQKFTNKISISCYSYQVIYGHTMFFHRMAPATFRRKIIVNS